MTSTNVTQAASLLLTAGSAGTVGNGNIAVADSFSQVMSRTSQNAESQAREPEKDEQTVSAKTTVKVDRSSMKETSNKAAQETSASEQQEKVSGTSASEEAGTEEAAEEILTEAVQEVKETIQEELGISEEELETIMSELGLTAADLLQPDTMQAIVMAAAGETDEMSILTDEGLYQNVQGLTAAAEDIVSDVKAQLQVDDAAFADMLQQMEAPVEAEAVSMPEMTAEDGVGPVIIAVQEQTAETEAVQDPVAEESEVTEIRENADARFTEAAAGTEEEISPETGTQRRTSETGKESGNESRDGDSHFLQSWGNAEVDTWTDNMVQEQIEIPYESVDTENIMNQITEYIKIEAKPGMTEMELQLQPETLGTLHIHLSAKEGVITAQFTAESEAVKAVLEAQILQLKENLNQQGVKVEAVEVTVASHEFDRNFSENGEESSRYGEPKKKGIRKLQLHDNIPLEEMELSEEDRIAAEMMEQNGNTVDYTA